MGVSFWKKDVENTIEIDLGSKDVYGAEDGFVLFTKFQDESAPTKQTISFSELVEEIASPVSVSTTADLSAGAVTIPVDDTSNISAGMRFSDGSSNIFYVEVVGTDSIVIRRGLKADIANDTTLTQVGNLGIYEAKFTPTKTGALVFLVSNPTIGLQNETAKVQVVNDLVDDVAGDIAVAKNEIISKLDNIADSVGADSGDVVVGRILA